MNIDPTIYLGASVMVLLAAVFIFEGIMNARRRKRHELREAEYRKQLAQLYTKEAADEAAKSVVVDEAPTFTGDKP